MKKLLIILMMVIPTFVYAKDRTVDERCHGYADEINKLLVNRYDHEAQKEQLELINEIDDKEYRSNLSNMLKYVYTLPLYNNEKDVKIQFLNQYIASYRMCIQLYVDR